jgi:hypothetical protein
MHFPSSSRPPTIQEAEITIYLHVTNNVRVYELTFVLSF